MKLLAPQLSTTVTIANLKMCLSYQYVFPITVTQELLRDYPLPTCQISGKIQASSVLILTCIRCDNQGSFLYILMIGYAKLQCIMSYDRNLPKDIFSKL